MTAKFIVALAFALAAVSAGYAESDPAPAGEAVPVNADNFARAESDLYFGGVVKDDGFGKFHHNREPTPLDKQTVIRMNRDTLYSGAVFDLDAGPVTVTLPDVGERFMCGVLRNHSSSVAFRSRCCALLKFQPEKMSN